MKASFLSLLIACTFLAASCPLGFTPEEACTADNPSCALFVDENGDSLCDNPGPQPEEDPQTEVEDTSEDSTEAAEDTTYADPSAEESQAEESESDPEETVSVVTDPPECVEIISSDEEGHLRCLNPEELSETEDLPTLWEVHYWITDSSTITEEIRIEISDYFFFNDTATTEKAAMCPLGFSPEQACSEDAPSCALFVDEDGDSTCDNPVAETDTSSAVNVNVSGSVYRIVPVASGCPRGLPPEAACPFPEISLCPHYMEKPGISGCINPSGAGIARTAVVLAATVVLLSISTYLRKRYCRMGRRGKRSRNIAHTVIQITSLLLLGFLVQGCFCPLGAIQYALLPQGLVFLGVLGIGILIVPMIWSAFFDRVYCGWVCPFGALQDMLGKLKVPRPFKLPHKVHRVMSGFRYLLALLFFGAIILASSGQLGKLVPDAYFCMIDPFHTVFSFFVIGSIIAAVAVISVLIFFPRFFCK